MVAHSGQKRSLKICFLAYAKFFTNSYCKILVESLVELFFTTWRKLVENVKIVLNKTGEGGNIL